MAIPEAVHTDLTAKDDLFIAAALDIDDTVHPGAGNDTVSGGWGDDIIDDGISHIHWAYGAWAITGPLVLIVPGTGGDDVFGGGPGNDTLRGFTGSDELYGGSDNDVLTGGRGADDLWGDEGSDRFVYNATGESTGARTDTIHGFDFGGTYHDAIDLRPIDAVTSGPGQQDFSWSNSTQGPAAIGVLKVVEGPGDSTLIIGNTGGDATPELRIEVADGDTPASAWEAAHFWL